MQLVVKEESEMRCDVHFEHEMDQLTSPTIQDRGYVLNANKQDVQLYPHPYLGN